MIDRIDEAVANGRITQAQANKLEQRINEGKLPLFFGRRPCSTAAVASVRGELKAASELPRADRQAAHPAAPRGQDRSPRSLRPRARRAPGSSRR